MSQQSPPFWSISAPEIVQQLHTGTDGLTTDEAKQRLTRYGSNFLKPPKRSDLFALVLAQFKSPITLILLCATGLSFGLRDPVDAFIVLVIVVVGVLWPAADFVPADPGDHHRALPHCSGDHEDGVLPEGESLTERPSIS